MDTIQLIERNWLQVFETSAARSRKQLRIVCPFVTRRALEHLVGRTAGGGCSLITRFSLADWAAGVSDPLALKWLLERGGEIRGVRGLHTKLYVFDDEVAILGSANLTVAALTSNHELGAMMTEAGMVRQCTDYFDALWDRLEGNLTAERLEGWLKQLRNWTGSHGLSIRPELPDYGTDASLPTPRIGVGNRARLPQGSGNARDFEPVAWVKLQGSGTLRMSRDTPILEEIERSGCHWACSYPQGQRPRRVRTGDTIFFARMMEKPNDTFIFGRAIAVAHVPGRDDATEADIARRLFKREYPHYVRVVNPQFLRGSFQNGISLFELMGELGSDTLRSTQRNEGRGAGNTNPRLSLRQRPAVELTPAAASLLDERLDAAFALDGPLDLSLEPSLDWPVDVQPLSPAGRRLLGVFIRELATEHIVLNQPNTFPTYRDVSVILGLPQHQGQGLGPQVRRNGLDDLDAWTRQYGLPAVTGFVVRQHERTPGETFFSLHNHAADDLQWWRSELHAAAEFPWERLL